MSWCLADVVQLHGDPGFGASRTDSWNDGTPLIYPSVDPTAAGAMPLEGAEAVPCPARPIHHGVRCASTRRNRSSCRRSNVRKASRSSLPPEQRQEGKPFILPPGERQEGKPFILPPDEQKEGKPFIEKQDQSLRRNRGARDRAATRGRLAGAAPAGSVPGIRDDASPTEQPGDNGRGSRDGVGPAACSARERAARNDPNPVSSGPLSATSKFGIPVREVVTELVRSKQISSREPTRPSWIVPSCGPRPRMKVPFLSTECHNDSV